MLRFAVGHFVVGRQLALPVGIVWRVGRVRRVISVGSVGRVGRVGRVIRVIRVGRVRRVAGKWIISTDNKNWFENVSKSSKGSNCYIQDVITFMIISIFALRPNNKKQLQ